MSDTHEAVEVPVLLSSLGFPEVLDLPTWTRWMEDSRATFATFRKVVDRMVNHPVRDLVGQRKYYVAHHCPIVEEDAIVEHDAGEECSICLQSFMEIKAKAKDDINLGDPLSRNDVVCLSSSCKHMFCREDLSAWMKFSNNCPSCREPVYQDEAAYRRLALLVLEVGCISEKVGGKFTRLHKMLSTASVMIQAISNTSERIVEQDVAQIAPEADRTDQTFVDGSVSEAECSPMALWMTEENLNLLRDTQITSEFFAEVSSEFLYAKMRMAEVETDIFSPFMHLATRMSNRIAEGGRSRRAEVEEAFTSLEDSLVTISIEMSRLHIVAN